jgi:hypothetical protein
VQYQSTITKNKVNVHLNLLCERVPSRRRRRGRILIGFTLHTIPRRCRYGRLSKGCTKQALLARENEGADTTPKVWKIFVILWTAAASHAAGMDRALIQVRDSQRKIFEGAPRRPHASPIFNRASCRRGESASACDSSFIGDIHHGTAKLHCIILTPVSFRAPAACRQARKMHTTAISSVALIIASTLHLVTCTALAAQCVLRQMAST